MERKDSGKINHVPHINDKRRSLIMTLSCAFWFLFYWRTSLLFVGPLKHLFWTSGDVSLGLKAMADPSLGALLPLFIGFL